MAIPQREVEILVCVCVCKFGVALCGADKGEAGRGEARGYHDLAGAAPPPTVAVGNAKP